MKLTIETTETGFALKLISAGKLRKAFYSQDWGKITQTCNRWQTHINQLSNLN